MFSFSSVGVAMKTVLRLALLSLLGILLTLPLGGCMAPETPNPVVVIDTSMGAIKVELFADKAPITVKNFLNYVDKKHYDNTIFHRVIKEIMIQAGGME